MALEKSLLFQNKKSGDLFYMLRLTSRRFGIFGQRQVMVVGLGRNNNHVEINPDELLKPNSDWEYKGGRVYEA